MDASVAAVLELSAIAELPAFVSQLEELTIDDVDWLNDLAQLQAAWRDFADRSGTSGRTFGNFRQHIARLQRGDSLDPGVRLLTVHKSQGREFKAVVVIACNEGQFPDFRAKTSEAVAAELRTFYVATSRASRALLLTRARQRQTRSGPWATEPSRFLELVPLSGN
jgi:ATP-dependent DNA helicase Rep